MICPRCHHGKVIDGICLSCGYDGGPIVKPQSLGPKVERGSLPNTIYEHLNLTNIPENNDILNSTDPSENIPTKPMRRGNPYPGHYKRVKEKIPKITKMIESGHGIRKISRETGLSINTIKELREDIKITKITDQSTEKPVLITKPEEIMPGNMPEIPPKPKGGPTKLHNYYLENLSKIIEYRKTHSDKETIKDWDIGYKSWLRILRNIVALERGETINNSAIIQAKALLPQCQDQKLIEHFNEFKKQILEKINELNEAVGSLAPYQGYIPDSTKEDIVYCIISTYTASDASKKIVKILGEIG